VRIPLDLYRILGIPQQTSEENIEQAYQDRLLQLPRREFSDAAVAVRNQLLAIAYETLSDQGQRQAYDQQWWGEDVLASEESIPLNTPELDCDASQLIGALLILLDLGEYELVLEYGEPPLNDPPGYPSNVTLSQDYLLCVTLAYWELSRERWQQQQYEFAATASLKALARLQRENSFSELQESIRQELYKLRPYRILELLTKQGHTEENRQRGLELLQAIIQDRGGIEGKGQDYSGLGNDDFLKFIHQLRCHLTVDEQITLFLPESQRPSLVASYLAVHSLIAQGVRDQQPPAIVNAKSLIAQLENCQDLTLEKTICELLLGQTEAVLTAIAQEDQKIVANLEEKLGEGQDPLTVFYSFTEQWLAEEIVPYFQDLGPDDLSPDGYFNNSSVQQYLEQLEPESLTPEPSFVPEFLPITTTESETPMVHSSAAFPDHAPVPTATPRRDRGKKRSRGDFAPTATLSPAIADNGNGFEHGNMGLDSAHGNGFLTGITPDSSPHKPHRRRKKRVTINPIRFGIFVLCLAAIGAGSAFLILSRTSSPLNTLEGDPLDLSLDQPSEFIPDEGTTQALIVSQPEFNQQVGQQVIQNWLTGKKLAFGQNHDFQALQNVLVPSLLAQQQGRAQADKAQQRYRQYEHKLQILDYKVNPQDPNRATVTARVEETSQPFSLANQQANGTGTKDDLTVRYQLVRQQGVWKIAQIQVVTTHP
jgi:curved DNA-binding protein CbpA